MISAMSICTDRGDRIRQEKKKKMKIKPFILFIMIPIIK
jgi:hypothetical protein